MISIAIIDDGINEGLYNTGSLKFNLEITQELDILERSGYDRVLPSHGTTCAAIIKKYCPSAVIGSIKVLNDSGRAVRDQLVAALHWCSDNAIRLVSLSLGTIDFRDYEAIRKAVNYAAQKGVIIVSACNNKDVYTYPASLSNVIGVKCDIENNLKEGQYRYSYYPLDGIDITACASHFLTKYDNSEKTTAACNSFAAPMITAMAYNILQQDPSISLEEMKHKLAEGAVDPLPKHWQANMHPRLDWVESALIFDATCSKKLKIPYRFTFKKIIDIECTDNREGIEKILEYLKKNKAIVNGIDTVIVNLDNSTRMVKDTCLLDLVRTLEGMNKTLVCLDDHWPYYVTCGEKAAIDVPVIAVCDFSDTEFLDSISKLKDIFREDGYNAVAVSYTCKGIAAGIEYIPCSENVPWDDPESISLEHINRIYNPDIILLGIDASNKEPDYFERLENRYEIDIKILILSEQNHYFRDMIDRESGSKIILVTAGDGHQNDSAGMVDICDKSYTEILYKYIIELFEEDGDLMDIKNNQPE